MVAKGLNFPDAKTYSFLCTSPGLAAGSSPVEGLVGVRASMHKRIYKGLKSKKFLFLVLFMAGALVADRINFSPLIGADNQYFTLFQFFGPIAASFLGLGLGLAALLGAQAFNFALLGKAVTVVNVLRLSTMLFAAYYFSRTDFSKTDWLGIAVPLAAMVAFVLTPSGGQAWYYTLYWLIPVAVRAFGWSSNLVARSLGATFTAHAVGGAVLAWTMPMTAAQWTALIPVVAYERIMFAGGIALTFVLMTTVLDVASRKIDLSVLRIERPYSILRFAAMIR